jgi:hypothetical protein
MKSILTLTGIILVCLASPTFVHAATVSIGSAINYGVLGLQGNANIYDSNAVVNGNVGISQGGTITNGRGATITGSVYEYSNLQLNGYCTPGNCPHQNFGTIDGTPAVEVSPTTLSTNDSDVASALSEIAALTPTETISGNVTSGTTITGDGGLNVIDLNGSVNLNNSNLTLTGTSSDYFVVEITGGLDLSGSAGLLLGGGVTANHVIYDFTDTGSANTCGTNLIGSSRVNYQICTSTNSMIYGTLIAPQLSFLMEGSVTGEVIGGQEIYLQSGDPITQDSFTSFEQPSDTPEPSTVLLLGTGLAAFAGMMRKRRLLEMRK